MTNKTFAVIDVGSNSVRLLISKNGKTINKLAKITRLSLGMTAQKTLSEDSIKRTIDALSFFKDLALNEYDADEIFIFATAGVRYAQNKEYFIKKVKDELDLDLDVVSGEVEAEIGALGALNGDDGGFVDLGGKSTEIAQIVSKKHVYTKSFDIGVVTLAEKFKQDANKIREYCKKFLKENVDKENITTDSFVFVGGTATTICSIVLGLKEYDFNIVDKTIISASEVYKAITDLMSTPVSERSKFFCVQVGREDVILSGAIFILEIMNYLNLDKITIRDSDNLEGYLIKKVGKND